MHYSDLGEPRPRTGRTAIAVVDTAIAVITDADPTMQYGIDTIHGTAAALLG